MALITFPEGLRPQTATYDLIRADAGEDGPFGELQVIERLHTAKWMQVLGFTALKGDLRRLALGFAQHIGFRGNTVRLPIFGYERGGPGGGTPLVAGAGQTGRTLATDGWPNSATVLRYGDLIEVNGGLHQLTADATTNGAGQVTLQIEPALKSSPADNAPIEYLQPTALFQFQGGQMARVTRIDEGQVTSDLTIPLLEA